MLVANKTKCYLKDNKWHADGIPVASLSRIVNIEFLGLVQPYRFQYKNGNVEIRWDLVETLGPDDEVWFLLQLMFYNMIGRFKIIAKINLDTIEYQWLTDRTMKVSSSTIKLYPLEIARIESTIEGALGQMGETK